MGALAVLRAGTGSRADPVLGLGFGDQPCRSGVWFPKCKVSVGLAGVIRVVSCAGRLVHLPVWANGSRGCSTSALGWRSSISDVVHAAPGPERPRWWARASVFAMGCLWACPVVWDRMIGAQRREAAGCAPSAPGEGRRGPDLAIGPGREPDGVYGGPQGPGEPQDGPVEPHRDRRRSGGIIDAQRLDPQGAIWPSAGSGSRRHRSQARPSP